jgi:hypothetical protein
MTNLSELDLWDNQISDLASLAGLTSLKRVQLDANLISDLSPLAGLTNLTRLDLSFNQISDVSPLAGLMNLSYLSLSVNLITDLTPLSGLMNLLSLTLSNNQISDLTPLTGLTNLVTVYIGDNHIFDWLPVAHVPDINGMSDQTGIILSVSEAQARVVRMNKHYIATYIPGMDKYDGEVQIYCFLVDYSSMLEEEYYSHISITVPAYAYVWINSLTRYTRYEEAGYSETTGSNWYANIPDCMYPIPMRNCRVIHYNSFWPPGEGFEVLAAYYSYDDKSVMEVYKKQLQDAGFIYLGTSDVYESFWTYYREADGATLCVEMYCEESFGMYLYVNYLNR